MKRWGYVLVFFLTAFSLGLLLPIMSLIFTGKGGTVKELSIGLSILSATVILLELPSGLFADLFGRRDTFCWSVIFQITSLFLCLSASFPVLYAGMALMGVGKALGSGSLEALFTDRYIEAYGKERLHQAVTARTISESTGIAMGSLLGAFLMRQSQRLFGVSEIGRISILTAIGSCVAGLILCLLLIPRDNGSFAPSGSDASGRDVLFAGMDKQFSACIHEIRRNRNLVFLLILILFTGMFLSNTERFWQVTLEARLPDKQLLWLTEFFRFYYDIRRKFFRLKSDRTRLVRQISLFLFTDRVIRRIERDGIAAGGNRICCRLYFCLPVCRIGRAGGKCAGKFEYALECPCFHAECLQPDHSGRKPAGERFCGAGCEPVRHFGLLDGHGGSAAFQHIAFCASNKKSARNSKFR